MEGNTGRVAPLAGLGGVLFGYDTGVIGGAQLFIEKDFHLSNFGDELLVATVLAGAIVGSLIASRLLEARGRRFGIVTSGVVFMVGTAGATAAPNATFLDASRIVVGVGIGLVSVAAPLYIAEMSTAERAAARWCRSTSSRSRSGSSARTSSTRPSHRASSGGSCSRSA